MYRNHLETEQKALEINLDDKVYGAFAEIGAGQEVARHFFQVGAAAGTIAKTMSAYDKIVSDDIYGTEEAGKGRYVCESRLSKMLDHEYALMESRLRETRPDQTFFAFADTVAAINFSKTIKGDGWLGLRFQLSPNRSPNDLILHVRMTDNDNRLQQQAVGILGVNMIYACFRYSTDPKRLLHSLSDNLRGRIIIDMVRLEGPDFKDCDNRLLQLWAVQFGFTPLAIFGPDKRSLHAGEFLYKKPILIARGSYRPPTLVQEDMIRSAYRQFQRDTGTENTHFLAEITIENLSQAAGKDAPESEIERDFLDRTELLCTLGRTVIISNCGKLKHLIAYFGEYKIPHIGLAMGVRKLQVILKETVDQNPDNLLGAFGELFLRNVRFYIYPARDAAAEPLLTAQQLRPPEEIHFLYDHLIENRNIEDIRDFNPDILDIYHKDALRLIRSGDPSWEKMVPPGTAALIKNKRLFQERE